MGTTIGEVSINLRLSTAQFQQDVKSGADASQQATKKIADDTKENTGNARESLRLLAEDIGVSLPRGVTNFLSELPGVGSALNAAFSSVAVIAILEVLSEVIGKLVEFADNAREIQKAIQEFGEFSKGALIGLEGEFLKLQVQMDNLRGDSVKALQDQLKSIDNQTLQNIRQQFSQLSDGADKLFGELKGDWVSNMLSQFPKLNAAIQNAEDYWGEFFNKGAKQVADLETGIHGLIATVENIGTANPTAALALIQSRMADLQKLLGQAPPGAWANGLRVALSELQQESERFSAVIKNADMQKLIAQTQELTNTYKQQAAELDSLAQKTQAALKPPDKIDDEELKIERLIQAWKNYQQELANQGIIAVSANSAIESLNTKLQELQEEAQASMDKILGLSTATQKFIAEFVEAGQNVRLPALGDTAQLQNYYAALTALNQQMQQGVFTTEQYAVALQNLKFQFGQGGAATGVHQFFMEFQTGQNMAKDTFNLLQTSLNGFEQDLAETLAKGTANWADFFAQIEEMILKSSLSTMFSSLLGFANNSDFLSGLGGGSLFGSGGLFSTIGTGHAEGIAAGPLDAGTLYPIGENGPEYFRPSVPGQVLNQGDVANMGTSRKSDKGNVTNITLQVQGVTDADSFKRSEPQIRAQMYRASSQAHARLTR